MLSAKSKITPDEHTVKATTDFISRHDGDEVVHDIVYGDGVDAEQLSKKKLSYNLIYDFVFVIRFTVVKRISKKRVYWTKNSRRGHFTFLSMTNWIHFLPNSSGGADRSKICDGAIFSLKFVF